MNFKQTQIKSDDFFLNQNFKELLLENTGVIVDSSDETTDLSKSQLKAFELFKTGQNMFMIGPGGSGKSKSIKTFQEYIKVNFPNKKIQLTSTTGVSAFNLGAITIHSFMGFGTGEGDIAKLLRRISYRKDTVNRLKEVDILILDEASMLSAELFEKINLILQKIRRSSKPFGGIQFVGSMDPLQLLPVFNTRLNPDVDERLIIESNIFNNFFTKQNIIVLTENFRQKGHEVFIDTLLNIRNGDFTEDNINLLNQRLIKNITDEENNRLGGIINVVTSNKKAQVINDTHFNRLHGPVYSYKLNIKTSGDDSYICDLLKKEFEYQFNVKGLTELKLKKDLRVMLIKNINTDAGLINGSMGTIIDFVYNCTGKRIPKVKFDNGIIQDIDIEKWTLEMNDCLAEAYQIPLIMSYSLTIHKLQSLTLDSVICDLKDCFCDGQVYVALSRVKDISGLYLKSFDPKKITVNKKMITFINNIQ